jgi:hypothetical protein
MTRTHSRELFAVSDLALLYGISRSEIHRDAALGRLDAPIVCGRRRATRQSVDAWLKARGLKMAAQ